MDENWGFQILMFSCIIQVFKNDPQNGVFVKMSAYHFLWQIETEVCEYNAVMHCTAHALPSFASYSSKWFFYIIEKYKKMQWGGGGAEK